MITQQHTPGPWYVAGILPAEDSSSFDEIMIGSILGKQAITIASVLGGLQAQHENALLIAAAPELLEAVYLCACYVQLVHLVNPTPESKAHLDLLESVIKKVTGEKA